MEGSIKELSKILDSAFRMREKADYQDFFIASKEDADLQIEKAEYVLAMISAYLKEQN